MIKTTYSFTHCIFSASLRPDVGINLLPVPIETLLHKFAFRNSQCRKQHPHKKRSLLPSLDIDFTEQGPILHSTGMIFSRKLTNMGN